MKRLDHYAIRTNDIEQTAKFYQGILGLTPGPRPNFPFPGVWLYADGVPVVHIVGIDAKDSSGLREYLGDRPLHGQGSGTVDHISFVGEDIDAMRDKLRASGLKFMERKLPYMPLDALFVEDPNGIMIEMNFPR